MMGKYLLFLLVIAGSFGCSGPAGTQGAAAKMPPGSIRIHPLECLMRFIKQVPGPIHQM